MAHFWSALVLLGVGWNFLYIGGTTLLTETYRPEERAKAQGANDQAIFIMMAISSFTSGLTVTTARLGAGQPVRAAAGRAGRRSAIVWYALHKRADKARPPDARRRLRSASGWRRWTPPR